MDEPITLKKALVDGLNAAAYAQSGFTRIENILKAIQHLATIASAGMTVAQEFLVIAEGYIEIFQAARTEVQS